MTNKTKSLTWEQYKIEAAKFATYPKENEEQYLLHGFYAEWGEIYGAYAKFLRGDYSADVLLINLKKEVGDVYWFLAMMENTKHYELGNSFVQKIRNRLTEITEELNTTKSEILGMNIAKLTDRMNRGKIQGSGDDR